MGAPELTPEGFRRALEVLQNDVASVEGGYDFPFFFCFFLGFEGPTENVLRLSMNGEAFCASSLCFVVCCLFFAVFSPPWRCRVHTQG